MSIARLERELNEARRQLSAMVGVADELANAQEELATCCLCEYEFDDPPHAKGRGRQVVCESCWPTDHAALGWKSLVERTRAEADALRKERDEATQRALASERFRAEDASSHIDDLVVHIKRWQKAERDLRDARLKNSQLLTALANREQAEAALATLREDVMTVVSDPHLTWRKARAALVVSLNRPTPPPEEPR